MNKSFMENRKIVSRCLSGEIEAFEMLVRKYQENIISLAWLILRDREEAKDLTQDTFIQCYAHLNRFDESRSFKNWLLSIAYKRCLDRKKKAKSLMKFERDRIRPDKSNTYKTGSPDRGGYQASNSRSTSEACIS